MDRTPIVRRLGAVLTRKERGTPFVLRGLLFVLGLAVLATALAAPVLTQDSRAQTNARVTAQQIGPSGLPVPRFVSLRRNEVNLRRGPSVNHAIEWVYRNFAGLPVLVVAEADLWRKIEDHEGVTGWVHGSLLDGTRTARIVSGTQALRSEPKTGASALAQVESGAIGRLERCETEWCQVTFDDVSGWMPREQIWGVLPDEDVD